MKSHESGPFQYLHGTCRSPSVAALMALLKSPRFLGIESPVSHVNFAGQEACDKRYRAVFARFYNNFGPNPEFFKPRLKKTWVRLLSSGRSRLTSSSRSFSSKLSCSDGVKSIACKAPRLQ